MRLLAIFCRKSNVLLLHARLRKSAVSLLYAHVLESVSVHARLRKSAVSLLYAHVLESASVHARLRKSAVSLLHASARNLLLQFCYKSAARARTAMRVSAHALT